MKCFGRTKKFNRCKKNCKFIFCKQHKLQWWATIVIIATLGGLFQDIIKPVFQSVIWNDIKKGNNSITKNSSSFKSIFPNIDKKNFNILIIRFEDYINEKDTHCIGRSIQENIGIIDANTKPSLYIKARYADSIPLPKSAMEAQIIQQKHNADLIIYGLARNIEADCGNAEICFRYNINENIVSRVATAIDLRTSKHDGDYILTSPTEIEKGQLQIDALSMQYWIKALVEIKTNNPKKAFLKLATILRDSTSLNSTSLSKKYFTIGKTYATLKQYERALIAYDKVIELNPLDAIAFNKRGIINKKLKKFDYAICDYNQAIALDSCYDHAYYNRGVAHEHQGNLDLAIKDLKKAIEINPEDEDYPIYLGYTYTLKKKYYNAILYHDMAVSLNPNEIEAYFYRAYAYKNNEQYDLALADYSKALSLDSTYASAYNSRGIIYKNLDEYELSLENYNQAIKYSKEKYANAYYNRGVLYSIIKKYKLSILDFDKFLAFHPEDVYSYAQRGIALLISKKYELAISDFTKSIELNDSIPDLYYYRGKTYSELKNYQKAIVDFDKAISFNPNNTNSYLKRAFVYSRLKKYKQANNDFTTCIKLSPKYANAYNSRGVLYLKMNKLNEAIIDFKKTIALDKFFYYAYVNLFYAYTIRKYWYLSSIFILLSILFFNRRKLYKILKKQKVSLL